MSWERIPQAGLQQILMAPAWCQAWGHLDHLPFLPWLHQETPSHLLRASCSSPGAQLLSGSIRRSPPCPPKPGSGHGAAGRTDATGQLPQHRLLPLKTYNLHKTAIVKPSHRAAPCEEGGQTHPRQSKTNPKVQIQQGQAEPGGDVPGQQALPAGTGLSDHVLILLVEDATVALDHEDTDGAVAVGDTGGPGHVGIHQLMDEALHHSMVGRMVVVAEQAGTGTLAVTRVVAVGSNDPVVPAQLGKADREGAQGTVTLLPSLLPQVAGQVMGQCPCVTPVPVGLCRWRCQASLGVVEVEDEEGVTGGHWGIAAPCPTSTHTDMLQHQARRTAIPQHQVRGDIHFGPAVAGTGSRAEQSPRCLTGGQQLQGTEEATTGQRQAGQVDHSGSEEVLGIRLALQAVGEGLRIPATCGEATVSAPLVWHSRHHTSTAFCYGATAAPAQRSRACSITTLKASDSQVPQRKAGASASSSHVLQLTSGVKDKE